MNSFIHINHVIIQNLIRYMQECVYILTFSLSYRTTCPIHFCPLGHFSQFFFRLLIFFKIDFYKKMISRIPSECQTFWIQIRPNVMSGLIWVQTVCKNYQQTTLVDKELTLFILETDKQVLWQSVKIQIKCHISQGLHCEEINIFRDRNTSFHGKFKRQPLEIQNGQLHTYIASIYIGKSIRMKGVKL